MSTPSDMDEAIAWQACISFVEPVKLVGFCACPLRHATKNEKSSHSGRLAKPSGSEIMPGEPMKVDAYFTIVQNSIQASGYGNLLQICNYSKISLTFRTFSKPSTISSALYSCLRTEFGCANRAASPMSVACRSPNLVAACQCLLR